MAAALGAAGILAPRLRLADVPGAGAIAPPPPPTAPVRIVSTNPCIDAVLVQLVARKRIAAVSHYSHDPRAASAPLAATRGITGIGDTAEEVIALRPDLVLGGAHLSPATRSAIARARLRLVTFGVPATLAESRAQVLEIASVVGEPARGTALVRAIDHALAAQRTAGPPVTALIWQNNGLVPGQGTLADELLTATGFRNASSDYQLKQWDIAPLEYLMKKPPRVIFASPVDRLHPGSREAAASRLGRSALARLGDRIALADFPDRLLYCAGPNLIEAATRLGAVRRSLAGGSL